MKRNKLKKRVLKTTADAKSQNERIEKRRDQLGEKCSTHYVSGKVSLHSYENGIVLKAEKQNGIVLTDEEVELVAGMIRDRKKVREVMEKL